MASTKLTKTAPRNTALAKLDDELAKYAQETADTEQTPSGSFVGTQGGILTVAGSPVKDNELNVIVVDFIYENKLYEGRYDPNNPTPPACYAFARTEEGLRPHEKSEKPQHDQCAGCPHNVFGTAEQGKGKACKNVRRLALIPYSEDPQAIADAEVFYLTPPVTSTKGWSYYVKALNATLRRPPFAVHTLVSAQPDPKTQFKVTFTPVGPLPDEVVRAVMAKREELGDAIMFPYAPKAEAPPPAAKAAGRSASKIAGRR